MGMVFLDRFHIQAFAANRTNTIHCRGSSRNGCDARDTMIDRGAANGFFIEERLTAERCIDDQVDLSALDVIYDMRPSFIHLVNGLYLDSGIPEYSSGPTCRNDLETHFNEVRGNFRNEVLIVLVHANEGDARLRQNGTRADLRLHVYLSERIVYTHHFSG